jgi:hypothetical protein
MQTRRCGASSTETLGCLRIRSMNNRQRQSQTEQVTKERPKENKETIKRKRIDKKRTFRKFFDLAS